MVLSFGWHCAGLGLALVVPAVQSLTADLHAPGSRGKAFGVLYLTAALGGMLGALVGSCDLHRLAVHGCILEHVQSPT